MFSLNKESGVTILELVLAMAIFVTAVTALIVFVNPGESKARTRDNKRLSDLQTLDRAITEYVLDTGNYPDTPNTLRTSTNLLVKQDPSDADMWINANLFDYLASMPIDPLNNDTYYYSYIQNNRLYELNARLETLTSYMQNDNGNDVNMYELGTNLNLISP